jgi:hypothetical protein
VPTSSCPPEDSFLKLPVANYFAGVDASWAKRRESTVIREHSCASRKMHQMAFLWQMTVQNSSMMSREVDSLVEL